MQVPPVQWGNHDAREGGEVCELFRDPPLDEDLTHDAFEQEHGMEHQDELNIAVVPSPSTCSSSNVIAPRCVNGQLVCPDPPRDDSPSTACNSSTVTASGGVRLGKATPPCSEHLQEYIQSIRDSCHSTHNLQCRV